MGLRINNNLASLNASLNLGRANGMLSKSLARLSTGLKINNAADGPADLIISEKFRSQINAISKATENTQNAISMLSTAEGALNEVNTLLNKMKGLALKAGQTGTQDPDEIAASQAEIDAALQSINSIARNTSFGSKFLLDGSLDIATNEVNADQMTVGIERAVFAGSSKRLDLDVIKQAAQAENAMQLNSSGLLDSAQTLKVTGGRGSSTITFAAGAAGSDISKEINDQTTQTGVTATFSSSTNKVTLSSVDYGATEFVVLEDVDGTADILRSVKEEQLTKATLGVSGQFTITAKEGGLAGENISLQVVSEGTSAATALGIVTDATTGNTQLTLTLQDNGVLSGAATNRFASQAAGTSDSADRKILTTLDDIKNLIESNATLNDLIDFSLVGNASVTDTFIVDNTAADQRLNLNGAASGEDAVAATLELAGATTGKVLTLTSKIAGAGGNDLKVIFGTGGELSGLARNALGSATADVAGYFSGSNDRWTFYNEDTLFVNQNATFAQISKSISGDTAASDALTVSYTAGGNISTISTTESVDVKNFTGGSGITGGKRASGFINLGAATGKDYGLEITSKKSGSEGNGFELVLRSAGSNAGAATISIVGDKVIYTMSSVGGGNAMKFSGFATATAGAQLNVIAKKVGAFANQFDFKFNGAGTTDGSANIQYDTDNKIITVNYEATVTTVDTISAAFVGSDAVLDTDSQITVAETFILSGVGGSAAVGTSAVGAVAGSFGTGLTGKVVSAGSSGTIETTAAELITALRGNASVRELIDVEYYGTGTTVDATDLATAAAVKFTSANMSKADDVFGDYRFVLTRGYDGDVASTTVKTEGTDGQVKVNGVETAANNLSFTFDNGDVRGTINLNESFNKTGNSSSFTIQSRGAFFQIGQKAQLSYQAGIALRNVSTTSLGTDMYLNPGYDTSLAGSTTNERLVVGTLADIQSGAKFDLAKNAATAVNIIDNAIADVSGLRARVGAFISNTLESNINSLGVAFENLTAAESRIRDVDFAAETAEFTRAQILVQAGTSIAAQANVATQAALQLLG